MLRPEVPLARKLRRTMSLPEVLVWQHLRAKRTGQKFRRQYPVGPYVADFYCRQAALIVEVDGEAHRRGDRPARDAVRDDYFTGNGYRVLRIAAADVLRDVDAVVTAIVATAANPLHHSPAASGPPPRAGEDWEIS
ncbi:endonuclease domain-containing protein [Sphingomonas mollis]|uniref:Endonuclease domain-containing protein n=1 Tax=Sphingomonas mollis TaxID=2795726 RepID=A0ABS0XRC3_9SPHN|nr:DUF559 domain-containing protein [Sphingomonas sp. BT553]MBJ6122589.1 endonuclease domain-containing protein [Sphingomonas sp. BT553]